MPEPATECAGGCGRMLRPYRVKKTDMPNTVAYHADGKCATCNRRTEENEAPGLKVFRRPPNCIKCGVELRSGHGKKRPTDPAESRRYAGRGMCGTCYSHRATDEEIARPVTVSPVPVNPPRGPAPISADAPADVQAAAAALAAWQNRRRARNSHKQIRPRVY